MAGATHHVTNRGTRKASLFVDDSHRHFFLERLGVVARRRQWRCLSYCLMSNHIHLVIETEAPTLGAGMRDLESLHARVLNQRQGTKGSTVEGRFGSRLVTSDEYFAQLLRYVALNPVKAAIVRRPVDYPWSSHADLLAHRPDGLVDVWRVSDLLEPWGGSPERRYARLFAPATALAAKYGDMDPATYRPPLADLLAGGADPAGGIRAARAAGYRLADIAQALGVHESTVSRRACKK